MSPKRSLTCILTAFALFSSYSSATLHHLFVGTFSGADIYGLEFDDESLSLSLINTNNASNSHLWLSFDHDKKNVYGVENGGFASYSVVNGTALNYDGSVSAFNSSSARSIFVVASSESPYAVYGATFGGDPYGAVLSVSSNGTLSETVQTFSYSSSSGVHGLALSPDQQYVYSADDSGNAIWTHKVDNTTGALTEVGMIDGPSEGSDPRHATVHPNGSYLYVVLEGSNEVASYTIDSTTGLPSFTNQTFPLIPDGYEDASYWSDEVQLSPSANYLWATSRSRNTNTTGYISAFTLSSSGEIQSQLFLTPTSTSGGAANAVSPAFFSDEWVAMTDSSTGFVQIWQFSNNTASVVAQVDITGTGCCANAIWYD